VRIHSDGDEEVVADPTTGGGALEGSPRSSRIPWLGIGAATLGTAALAAGWITQGIRSGSGGDLVATDPTSSAYLSRQAAWLDSRPLPLVFSLSGATLLFTGVMLVAPTENGFPWISLAGSVVGAALVTWGLIDMAGHGSCDGDGTGRFSRACVD